MATLQDNMLRRDESLDEIWEKIAYGLDEIMCSLSRSISHNRYIELYTTVYDYCTASPVYGQELGGVNLSRANFVGEALYSRLTGYLSAHLVVLRELGTHYKGVRLLNYIVENWDRYTTATSLVSDVMQYINRHWVRRRLESQKTTYDTYTLSLVLWKDVMIVGSEEFREEVISALLDLIEKDREGQEIDRRLVKKVLDTFISVCVDKRSFRQFPHIYREYFEVKFLDKTASYYVDLSRSYIHKHTPLEYMRKTQSILQSEEERMNAYLYKTTHSPLRRVLESTLIEEYTHIMENDFDNLIKSGNRENLELLYKLLSCVPTSSKKLAQMFENYARTLGTVEVNSVLLPLNNSSPKRSLDTLCAEPIQSCDAETSTASLDPEMRLMQLDSVTPEIYVNALLDVHRKLKDIVETAFHNDNGIMAAFQKACRSFVNNNGVHSDESRRGVELFAKYMDILLRTSSKNVDISQIEQKIKDTMVVFKYIQDKDIFQRLYQKLLAKRLVYNASLSEELELKMVDLIKDACGLEYSSKLQRMFSDTSMSRDLHEKFLAYIAEKNIHINVESFFVLLGGSHWHLMHGTATGYIPKDLKPLIDAYCEFYKMKFSGRKLTWLFNLGSSELSASCFSDKNTPTIITVTNYQMFVLLLYNDKLSYTFAELQSILELSHEQLKSHLSVLIKRKLLLLENDTYTLNTSLKPLKPVIKLYQVYKDDKTTDREPIQKSIDRNRKIAIQAAIVRLMKKMKIAQEQQIFNELKNIQNFTTSDNDIRECIGMLVENEYIGRIPNNLKAFRYIA